MTPAHRVVMNTGILYARMAITVVLSLYTTRVVLDALGIDDFGIFNLVGGVIAMLTFLNASMAAATQRFMSFAQGQGDEGRRLSIFNGSLVLHADIALVLLRLLQIAGYVLCKGVLQREPDRMHAAWVVYQISIITTLFTIIGVPYDAVVNARENMLLFAVLGIIESVLKLLIALLIVDMAGDKLVVYGVLTAITAVILFALRAAYCHVRYQECSLAIRTSFDKRLLREMTAFAGWSFLGSSTSMLTNYGQGLLLNIFFGATANAAQGIASQVNGQLSVFANTMLRALNPMIVKSEGAGHRQRMLVASMLGNKIGFFLLTFFYVPVFIEMPMIFSLWLVTVPEYAIVFCRLMLIRSLVEQLYVTLNSSISAVGNIRNFQLSNAALNIFPLAVAAVLFYVGAHPATLYMVFIIYAILGMIVAVYFASAYCQLSIAVYFREVVVLCSMSFLFSLLVTSLPLLWFPENIERLFLVCGVSVIVVPSAAWFFGSSKQDRKMYVTMFRSLLSRVMAVNKKGM